MSSSVIVASPHGKIKVLVSEDFEFGDLNKVSCQINLQKLSWPCLMTRAESIIF
jgi:hypothetical protein